MKYLIVSLLHRPFIDGLRDYGVENQIGLENSLDEFIAKLLGVAKELYRVLKPTGILFWEHNDSYCSKSSQRFDKEKYGGKQGIHSGRSRAGSTLYKAKCMWLQNFRLVLKMVDEQGFILRQIICWLKPNALPSSVRDRLTNKHSYIFFFVKNPKYYFDLEAIREPLKESSIKRAQYLVQAYGSGKDGACFSKSAKNGISKILISKNEKMVIEAGYNPDEICPRCGRSWRRHIGREGQMKKFIPCITNKKDKSGASGWQVFKDDKLHTAHIYGTNPGDVWSIPTAGFSAKKILGPNTNIEHWACVDEETECLTAKGWKKWNELEIEELVAAFDLGSGKLKWERLEDIYVYNYNNTLLEFSNNCLGFKVTPNHRMIYRKWYAKNSNYNIKRADRIAGHDRLPVAGEWEENSYGLILDEPTPNVCELLGWISSDGYIRDGAIEIYQSLTKNPHKVDKIEKILIESKIDYKKYIYNRKYKEKKYQVVTFRIKRKNAKSLVVYLDNTKPTWKMLMWSKEGIKRFVEGFIGGDGHIRSSRLCFTIIQKDKETKDILQALLFRLGYRAIVRKRNIYISNRRLVSTREKNEGRPNIKKTKYIGKVWCPQTQSTTFVARKNGNILITGNTFPEKLVERLILCGCPKETCVKCGKPKIRKLWREYVGSSEKRGARKVENGEKTSGGVHCINTQLVKKISLGWEASCKCNVNFNPGIVLDPFMGSGTVGVVAKRLGRSYVGIELNPDFVKLAEERIRQTVVQQDFENE